MEAACLRQDIGRALCLLERGVELGRGSSHPVGAIVELAQQLGVAGGVDVGAGCLLVDDGARHLVGVAAHGRCDLAFGHVAHRAALDVEELGVLLELDLVAALHLDRGHDVELLEQVEVLLVDHGRGGIHRGLEVEQPAAFRLVEPLVGVAVTIEDDVLMRGERGAYPGKRGLFEVLRAVDCLREVFEGLRDGGVEDRVGIGQVDLAARHAELELVAGEGERGGAVAVGVVLQEVGECLDAQVDVGLLGVLVLFAVDDALHHAAELVAQEDGDDRRRRLVGTQTMVVAGAGNGAAQQVLVIVDGLDGCGQEDEEAQVADGGLAGVEQVHRVGGDGPVVVLARAVHTVEGLLMLQADQAMVAGDGLHELHGDQVVVDGAVGDGENRRELVLCGCDLVVLGLGGDAELPQRVVELLHEVVDGGADRAKVVLLELLALARRSAEQRASGEDEVLALLVVLFFDEEVLLLGAHGGDDARHLEAEQLQDALGLVADGFHGAQERGLLVERLARVGAKRGGDAQHLVFDERVAGRVPGGVAAGLEGGAQTAAGEGGGVGLALDELLAREGHDGAAVVLRVDERIVLLGGDAGERLEPVRVVRGAVFDGPFLHRVGDDVGDLEVERAILLDGLGEVLVDG